LTLIAGDRDGLMKKGKSYFKVYGVPVVPKPLREVFLKTFETKNEADVFIMSLHKLHSDGNPIYKGYRIKVGAYRNEK
jgi:hypothetical protein